MFTEPEEAVHALSISRDFSNRQISSFAETKSFAVRKQEAVEIVAAAAARKARQLPTNQAFQVLSCYGIPLAEWTLVTSARETTAKATEMGFPVAMKVVGEGFIHKSDVGGVILDLKTEAEAGEAYNRLSKLKQESGMDGDDDAVLIQRMVPGGHEVFIGGKQDPTFGPVVLVGLGGIHVEVFGDVAIRVAPVGAAEARKMSAEIRGGQILQGVRGQPAADVDAFIEIIQRVSQLVCDLPQILEMDMNPLVLSADGKGCLAVDCRMVLTTDSPLREPKGWP